MHLSGYKEWLILCALLIMVSINRDYAATEMSVPSIKVHPSSKNVSLNGTVSFNCSALHVVYILWQVNYTSIDSIPHLDDKYVYEINGDMSTSRLKMEVHQGLEINLLNNTVITCVGYNYGLEKGSVWFTNISNPALLLIQGTLEAPSNVSSIYDNSTFVVSWLPPFTLEGVHVKYLVQVTKVSENGAATPLDEHETENETASIVNADNSSCALYTMTCVTPMTDAGKGQPGCANVSSNDATGSFQSTLCTSRDIPNQANSVMISLSTTALIGVMTLLYATVLF